MNCAAPSGEILSVYDATVARPATGKPWDDHAGDPILDSAVPPLTSGFQSIRRRRRSATAPNSPIGCWRARCRGVGLGRARGRGRARAGAVVAAGTLLLASPKTRVLVVNGRYDLVTPYLASRWLLDQLAVPDAVRDAIRAAGL